MSTEEMTSGEIEQFLTCARIGRLGLCLDGGQPYVVPVGYAYTDGKIFFHTCNKGLKMERLRQNANVCFEVDEALSDASMCKSVVVFGTAEIISDRERMIPYLQKLIDKYRAPENFDTYMNKPGRNREKIKESRLNRCMKENNEIKKIKQILKEHERRIKSLENMIPSFKSKVKSVEVKVDKTRLAQKVGVNNEKIEQLFDVENNNLTLLKVIGEDEREKQRKYR